ncbi:PTS lactose transporter subunit IIB [Brachybacterium huguangmaarense]|uniref:PTS lactose transporter subunit IIB n=1 Tax=Brachybacterium huguangmaarense TaxID=1652028 RepID=A0ABY6G689_9MICO|nr:PTS lactose transporter subunit IIB [Brachybacterium huguangmaarense]UYG18139.1 PTS lactose transporter subunit IIB [Brachybacterium huguangmaarense]
MRTIAVVCGAGVATSALIASRVREHLDAVDRPARVVSATVMDLLSPDFRADIVVSTVEIPPALGIPVVSGMPLLLQTTPDVTFSDIDRLLAQLDGPA